MVISQLPSSKEIKTTPYHASSKRKASSVMKGKSFQKRPTGSQYITTKKEEIDDIKKPIICYKKGADQISDPSGCCKEEFSALDRANEVQARLPSNIPSFIKLMLKSHVTGGFWLGLPKQFCCTHLPKSDVTVFLVDESEKEYTTKYLWEKNGLSAGWRGFSIAHNLLEGDVLVFQLIKPCRFKVYIIRVNSLAEIDGAMGLLKLDFQAKSIAANALLKEEDENVKNVEMDSLLPPPKYGNRQDYTSEKGKVAESASDVAALDQSANKGDDLSPEVLEGIRFSESVVEFKDVKSLESFSILVDGLVIDSETPMHIRTKYYQLCCSQNAYLHDHLFKGLNCKLVAGVISETVNIADAIRAAKLTTPLDYLQVWDETLKAFEDMGMRVGFLRARIKKLVSLQSEQRDMIESKTNERARIEEEIRNLETKLLNVKEVFETLNAEIKILKVQNEGPELAFKETATAPWAKCHFDLKKEKQQ